MLRLSQGMLTRGFEKEISMHRLVFAMALIAAVTNFLSTR